MPRQIFLEDEEVSFAPPPQPSEKPKTTAPSKDYYSIDWSYPPITTITTAAGQIVEGPEDVSTYENTLINEQSIKDLYRMGAISASGVRERMNRLIPGGPNREPIMPVGGFYPAPPVTSGDIIGSSIITTSGGTSAPWGQSPFENGVWSNAGAVPPVSGGSNLVPGWALPPLPKVKPAELRKTLAQPAPAPRIEYNPERGVVEVNGTVVPVGDFAKQVRKMASENSKLQADPTVRNFLDLLSFMEGLPKT